jgi:hypothetical protein
MHTGSHDYVRMINRCKGAFLSPLVCKQGRQLTTMVYIPAAATECQAQRHVYTRMHVGATDMKTGVHECNAWFCYVRLGVCV